MIGSNSRAFVLALVLLVPTAANAQPPRDPPTEAQIEAARALYKEARELHKQGRIKEAIDRALEAYKIAATPVTALEAGTLLVEAGRLVEARDLLRAVTAIPVSPRESDKGRDARQQAASLAASLDGRIPKIAIAGKPSGAEVSLDGRAFGGDANAWQGVDPGAHTIVVRVGDRTCATIAANVAEGEEKTVDLHAAAKSCAPEPAPPPPPAASSARAVVAPPPPPPPQEPPSSTRKWIGAVVAGVGVVAVGAGGIVAIAAKSDYDSVAGSCTPRGCSHAAFDARESARSRADFATIVMVVGGVAAAGGAALFFWPTSTTNVAVGAGSVRVNVAF